VITPVHTITEFGTLTISSLSVGIIGLPHPLNEDRGGWAPRCLLERTFTTTTVCRTQRLERLSLRK